MTTTPPSSIQEYSGLPDKRDDGASLPEALAWYRAVLFEITPRLLDQPGLGRLCALRVDDPVAQRVVRMIARRAAEWSGAEVARYCMQTGFGAPLRVTG